MPTFNERMAAVRQGLDYQELAESNPEEYYRQTPLMRSLWEGRLPTWAGQAYEQAIKPAYDAWNPKASDIWTAPLAVGGAIVDDVAQNTKAAMQGDPDAATRLMLDAVGGGGVASKIAGTPDGALLGANVWQGGPHKYGPGGASKSLEHINKGEGAQAYGWGRYDAGANEVGEAYRRQLANHSNWAPETLDMNILERLKSTQPESVQYEIKHILDGDGSWTDFLTEGMHRGTPELKTYLAQFDEAGYLYKHDLPDEDIARYLDWDKPLSEQPEGVRDAITALRGKSGAAKKELAELDATYTDNVINSTDDQLTALNARRANLRRAATLGEGIGDDMTGAQFYENLQARRVQAGADYAPPMGKQAASEALRDAGIPGLKYYDGMSRNAGEGTRNYVTWDQDVLDRMKLLERNGETFGANRSKAMAPALLPRDYYPRNVHPIHPVYDWRKARSMARAAIRGDEVQPFLVDGDILLTGTHRSAANDLLEMLGRDPRIGRVDISDVTDVALRDKLRKAADEGDFDALQKLWDDTALHGETFGANRSKPAAAMALADDEARAVRAGPTLTQDQYETINRANSKKRKRWSPDGEKRQSYNAIEDVRQSRRDNRPLGEDPLETKNRTRGSRLDMQRAAQKADASVDELWSKNFAAEVHRDVSGGWDASGAINRANMEAAPRILKKEGWTVRHGSKSKGRKSSRYIVSPDGKTEVRLSDHELPNTAQRRHTQGEYGTRWTDEIILQGDESVQDIILEIKRLHGETFSANPATAAPLSLVEMLQGERDAEQFYRNGGI